MTISVPHIQRYGFPVTGPRGQINGERESFIVGYSWQRSGLVVGSQGEGDGGGGCSHVSSR